MTGFLPAAVATACATAPPVTTLAGGETGRIAFETATPSGTDFLTAAKGTPRAVIWGDLELSRSASGRVPTVVLVHGSSGVGPNTG